MKFLITGSAGFIGFHVSNMLMKKNYKVIGVDNLNSYYSKTLKKDRNKILLKNKNYKFYNTDITKISKLEKIFKKEKVTHVINLAAQAGVRYSLKHPRPYIDTNLLGFFNVLNLSQKFRIKNFLYASSSSVYGYSKKKIFNINDKTDNPLSLYAATKKSNELISYTYKHLYKMNIIGLRFFTVYGEYGRPDMSLFMFVRSIINNKIINVNNKGEMMRSFTYVGDLTKIFWDIINLNKNKKNNYKIYNIGNIKAFSLKKYIKIIEECLGKKANKRMLGMQKGDVKTTKAGMSNFNKKYKFTDLKTGINNFINWYKEYYLNHKG